MPAFFLELFSEEIPARMQARAAEDLARLVGEALAALSPTGIRTFHAPRRIALAADFSAGIAESRSVERGPRRAAPEQALAGFLRKHGAVREELREEGEFWVLDRASPGIDAATLIAREMPGLLRRFPWPKSMRWGGTSGFTWVRPLRRIVCLIDGAVVGFDLRDGADDGHGLVSGNLSEGHRFMSPGAFQVTSCDQWVAELRTRHVIVDPAERRALVADGVKAIAGALSVVDDPGLTDEVAGLVEWPVALLGRIDAAYMDLPAEVMQVSMRVNQRYFALRDAAGQAAPHFAFVANIAADDGGAAIVAGNERVLRARFSDARHFWDQDRRQTLESRVAALDGVTFHARLGSQGDRVRRIVALADEIAPRVGADPALARRAALLAKADLTTGMVAEFPELQGAMGRYYALHDGEAAAVADAVRDHYAPKGPSDAVPESPVSVAVALADKIDQLTGFFGIGEKPTGSGDPYALRRAALGIIRIVTERGLRVNLAALLGGDAEVLDFLAERLRVQLRGQGARHDVLAAVLAIGAEDDFVRLLARTSAVATMLATDDGANLLAAYRRAANILRIETKKDGPHDAASEPSLFDLDEERALAATLDRIEPHIRNEIAAEAFGPAMTAMAALRAPLDAFFDKVTVNDPRQDIRRNRLRLLSRVTAATNLAADFSKIEG